MPDEYIKSTDAVKIAEKYGLANGSALGRNTGLADCIASEISGLPAADVAEVVRCRDCKHAWIHPCGYVYCHRDGRNAYEMTFNIDGFCSYGERKKVMDYG